MRFFSNDNLILTLLYCKGEKNVTEYFIEHPKMKKKKVLSFETFMKSEHFLLIKNNC